jgi:hypothetical protein
MKNETDSVVLLGILNLKKHSIPAIKNPPACFSDQDFELVCSINLVSICNLSSNQNVMSHRRSGLGRHKVMKEDKDRSTILGPLQ